MTKRSATHPSGIPVAVLRDSVLKKAMTTRRNLLERFAFLSKRINPYDPKRSEKEKTRTQERKDIAAQLRDIERDCMRWIGEYTLHPEIYTPSPKEKPLRNLAPKIERDSPHDSPRARREKEKARHKIRPVIEDIHAHDSRYDKLQWKWREARRPSGSYLASVYRRAESRSKTKTRHRLAREIQDIEWKWLTALHERLFPESTVPPRHIVHPSRYKP